MPHDHAHDTLGNEKRVRFAFFLTAVFMVVEVAGGWLSGSLALLADAGHMLADAVALGLAWAAFRIGRRPSDPRRSYGYHRFQVLAAFVNGVTLVGIVAWIAFEAVGRLLEPRPIIGGVMLAVAAAGLMVNLAAFLALHGGDRDNLNLRGAALHVMGDMLGSAAALLAAGVVIATGWTPVDPLLSLAVAALILRSAWMLVRKSAHILLEGTPDWLDVAELRSRLIQAVPAVTDVHHVHVWSLTTERPLITLHAEVGVGADLNATLAAIKGFLEERYGIAHSTVQIESGACADGH